MYLPLTLTRRSLFPGGAVFPLLSGAVAQERSRGDPFPRFPAEKWAWPPGRAGKPVVQRGTSWICSRVRERILKAANSGNERGGTWSLQLNRPGDEVSLRLGDGVVDGHAGAFGQHFHAEDLEAGHGAVLVGRSEGDVEGQDLVRVPGHSQLGELPDRGDALEIQGVDGGAQGRADVAGDAGLEDGRTRGVVGVDVRGTDLIGLGDELAACLWLEGEVSTYSGK